MNISFETILTTIQGIAFIATLVYLIVRQRWVAKGDPAADLAEQKALAELLDGALFGIVTEVERAYGDKTGKLKLSTALERLIALVPDKWRSLLNADFLQGLIEKALSEAKERWAANPALILKDEMADPFAVGVDLGNETETE
jgi:hypothetical protein